MTPEQQHKLDKLKAEMVEAEQGVVYWRKAVSAAQSSHARARKEYAEAQREYLEFAEKVRGPLD